MPSKRLSRGDGPKDAKACHHPREGPRPQTRPGLFVVKSGDADVLGLRTLGALRDVELDLLILVKRLVAAGLDGGEVDEHVLAAAVLRDEAETLVGVEPLDGSLSHDLFLFVICRRHCAPKPLKTSTLVLVSSEPNPGVRDTSRGFVPWRGRARGAVPSTGPTIVHSLRIP